MQDLKVISVPNYEELQVRFCFNRIIHNREDMLDYLPKVSNDSLPEFQFFWGVFSTLYYPDAVKFIEDIELKKKQDRMQKQKG